MSKRLLLKSHRALSLILLSGLMACQMNPGQLPQSENTGALQAIQESQSTQAANSSANSSANTSPIAKPDPQSLPPSSVPETLTVIPADSQAADTKPVANAANAPSESPLPVIEPSLSPSETPDSSTGNASPFSALENQDLDDLSQLFAEELENTDALSSAEENEIYNDLFSGEQPAWEDFISFDLTTDGGALLFTDDTDFSLQQRLNILTGPKAWLRKERRRGKRRVKLSRVAPGKAQLWVVQEITGIFVIDRDGSLLNPSPGEKTLQERMIQRLLLERTAGKWRIQGASQAVIVPQKAQSYLPRIQAVGVRGTEGQSLRLLTRPLDLIDRSQIPVLPANQNLRFEAKVANTDTRYTNPQFVYMHAFKKRLRMYDNGLFGDETAGDGIYSREVKTPATTTVGLQHLAFDAISSQTMSDENSDNYQAMAWMIHFRTKE